MTTRNDPRGPRLTVVGSGGGPRRPTGLRQSLADGTAAIAAGGILAGGFGVEAAKSVMSGESAGRWWFVLGCVLGLALIGLGFRQRERAERLIQVGIVVTAADARRGTERAKRLDEQAETHSRGAWTITLKTGADLPADGIGARDLVEALADQTLAATTMAERLSPGATRINLIPTMPLHVAFHFGARLGHTHAREVTVHAIRQADGAPPYFPATSLRAAESDIRPLAVEPLETIDGGNPSIAALALDLQGLGDRFTDQVRHACRRYNIGHLLRLRSAQPRLSENQETFTGVVEQTVQTWQQATLPASTRTGRHAIFLSGPAAVAVTLGARLAAPDLGRWTAYTLDNETNTYEPFPPSVP